MTAWKTIVIEDDSLYRNLLGKMLQGDSRFDLLGMAENGKVGLRLCEAEQPDFLLIDIQMPEMDGLEMAESLLATFPDTKILALTSLNDSHTITRVLESGLAGYVEKSEPFSIVQNAIITVAQGGVYFTQSFEDARRKLVRDPNAYHKILSRREQQVLKLIAQGKSSAQIAKRLKLSDRTVGNHRYNLMKKLGIKNVAELVTFAIKHGFRQL